MENLTFGKLEDETKSYLSRVCDVMKAKLTANNKGIENFSKFWKLATASACVRFFRETYRTVVKKYVTVLQAQTC